MNNTSKIVLHSQVALPKEYSNFLKEGNSVLVRILKQNSQNSYIVSFAGGRFSIKSNEKLLVGSSFRAKVSFVNGKLNLIKINSSVATNAASRLNDNTVNQKNIIQQFNLLSPEVSNLLLSLGLPSDNVSKLLVQTMIASGVQINVDKIKKARLAATAFAGKEQEASEAALILLEKGIEPSPENIKKILITLSQEDFTKDENFYKNSGLSKSQTLDFDLQQIESELKNYFNSTQNIKNVPNGILTIFNHLCSFDKKQDNFLAKTHWIILPFDFEFCKDKNIVSGTGVFRVFFELDKKNVKKIVVNFKNSAQVWTFVVNYKEAQIESIKFCHFPQDEFSKNIHLEKTLSNMFDNVLVKLTTVEELIGFANKDVSIPVVKGII